MIVEREKLQTELDVLACTCVTARRIYVSFPPRVLSGTRDFD